MLRNKLIPTVVLAVAMMLFATAVAPANAATDEVSVGDFLVRLAAIMNLNATNAIVAEDSLRDAGFGLPDNLRLEATLTEAHVVAVSQAAGLRLTTSNPDSPFIASQVETYFLAFGDELAQAGGLADTMQTRTIRPYGDGNGVGYGPPFDPFTKGKGKHKGHAKGWNSPTEPE